MRGLVLLAAAAVLLPGHASAESATSLGAVTRVSGHVMVSHRSPDKMGTLAFKDAVFEALSMTKTWSSSPGTSALIGSGVAHPQSDLRPAPGVA